MGNVIGIVAEYNPFHNGHARLIEQTRAQLGAVCPVVCVMSGDFVQRGSPAVYSKFARAEAAVRCGADLVRELPLPERQALVERDPAYGNILCRCEQISEGEIRDAIRRSPGARSLDGVKRRVRAGMGRCQGGFCAPRVMELLSEELGVPQTQLTKSGGGSLLLTGETKEVQA